MIGRSLLVDSQIAQRDSSDWTGVLVKHDNGNETE